MCFLILFLLFQSCRMKVQECQRKGYYHVGFIDPYNIHEESVRKWPNRIENNILRALHKQNTCQYILFPYNFEWFFNLFLLHYIYVYIYPTFLIHICVWNRFHWILLIIEIDRCRVRVYDSLRKPTYYYQDLINIIQKAWARFLQKHIGISSPPAPLEFTTNWPVRIHIAHLLSFL